MVHANAHHPASAPLPPTHTHSLTHSHWGLPLCASGGRTFVPLPRLVRRWNSLSLTTGLPTSCSQARMTVKLMALLKGTVRRPCPQPQLLSVPGTEALVLTMAALSSGPD